MGKKQQRQQDPEVQRAVIRAAKSAVTGRVTKKTATTGRFLSAGMTGRVKSGSVVFAPSRALRRATPPAPRRSASSAEVQREMSVSEARERMSDVVSAAQYTDVVTYLTRHGKRVAAIISAEDAEWLEQVLAAEDAEDREALAEYRAEQAAGEQPVPFSAVRDSLLADDALDDEDGADDFNHGGAAR